MTSYPCSAGLANKQNKHVLVAPTSKGPPTAEAKVSIYYVQIAKFFRIPENIARAFGTRVDFSQNICRQIRSSKRGHGAAPSCHPNPQSMPLATGLANLFQLLTTSLPSLYIYIASSAFTSMGSQKYSCLWPQTELRRH